MKKILLIVIFASALTACSSTNAATPDGPGKATLNIEATSEGYDSSTYVVPAGAEITVHFANHSPLPHKFAVLKQGEHAKRSLEAQDEEKILWEVTAQSGETRTDIFQAPGEPGEYDVVCPFPGHIEGGMKATLVVEEDNK